MQCGAQVYVVQKDDPAEAARAERDRLLRKYKLSEVQTSILCAVARSEGGGRDIFVCGGDQLVVGEVKAGGQRFEGNDAVVAVAGLAGPGLIAPHGEDCFRLTADGERLAKTLAASNV
jgi:hypothetical protein